MKRELIEAWAKYLENNYSVGPVDYEAMKSMDTVELVKNLYDLALEACKKKIFMEHKNFLDKVSKISYNDIFRNLEQIKLKNDAAYVFLKEDYYPLKQLSTEELLVLIKYSNILDELYLQFGSYKHTCLKKLAKEARINNANFEANITIRTTSSMNESTNVSTQYLLKDYDTAISNLILPILTDTEEKYDCIVSSYYSDPITEKCVFYSSNHYIFEYNNNKWEYKEI